jgi:tetratricopeptide (TPR) repeat protein
VALLGVLARQRGDERADNAASNLMLLGALACGVAFAILGGTRKIWEELYDKDLSKLGMFLWGKPMVRDNPVFGVGRGAFESVFPMYRGLAGAGVYSHAENFVVQWIVEWGLPVGLAAMGLFAWTFAPKRLGALRSKTIAGAWCAAFALSAQNLLDLAFEVPAVMIALAALLGSIWGDRARPKHGDAIRLSGPFTRPRAALVAAGVACAGLLFGAVALASGRHDDDLDRRDAYEVAEASKADPAPVRSALHAAMSRHPAEPFFPLLGATVAFRAHDQSPIPWIQRSLERALVNGRAHLLLAQVLQQRGAHKQALLEMRLAAEDDKGLMGYLGPLAVGYARSFEELLATVPENETGGLFLSSYAALLRRADARPAEAELGRRCDLEAIRRDPTLLDPRIREAEARIAALSASKDVKDAKDAKDVGGSGIAICADAASCRQEVLEQANAIARLSPASALPAILEAHLLIAEGKPEEAAKSLESACAAVKPADRAGCLQVRVTAAAKVKAPALLDAASKELLGAACVTPQSCANTATLLASLRMSRGENGAGLALLARATREDPSDDGRWIALADAASAAGAHAEALNALEHVARRRGNDYGPIAARLAAERALVSNRMYLKQ